MHHIKTQETNQMTRIQSTQMGKEDESSPTWTSTSSCDAARLVAFAVAESALLDSEADEGYPFHSFASSYSKNHGGDEERIVNHNTPSSIPTHTFPPSPFETPPAAPVGTKPGKAVKNLRPDAPVFSPPRALALSPQTRTPHTRSPAQHTRTRSDLLPAIALSTQTHRRISSISTSSPVSSSQHQGTSSSSEARAEKGNVNGKGDLPFPRTGSGASAGARRSRAGMPTLAEITAYYATRPTAMSASSAVRASGASNSSKTTPNITPTTQSTTQASTSSQSTTTTPFAQPRTRTFLSGEEMAKRCSLSSNSSGSTSGSGWSSGDSEGPRTPPAEMPSIYQRTSSEDTGKSSTTKRSSSGNVNAGRRESASRLPTFLRAASPDNVLSTSPESGKSTERSPYNALATALARHRRTASASSHVQSRTVPDGRTHTPPPPEKRWMVDPPRRASSLDAAAHSWDAPTPERRRTEEMPGIQVTPPSSTIPHVPAFSRRPTAPTRQPQIPATHAQDAKASLLNSKPQTEHWAMDIPVPNLRLTPPTAIGGQGVSPLRRLEAEVAQQARATVSLSASGLRELRAVAGQDCAGGKREQQAERMLRILGKRTGVVASGPGRS